jgi:hypothetical protein
MSTVALKKAIVGVIRSRLVVGSFIMLGGCAGDNATDRPQAGASSSTSSASGAGTSGAAGSGGAPGSTGGTAGASGASGSGGTSGSGSSGASGVATGGTGGVGVDGGDAGASGAMDGGAAADGGDGGTQSAKDFLCNLMIGTSVQHDWFISGFETYVDGSRWEAIAPSQAGISFIQMWADPKSTLWNMAEITPCAQRADNPDRVIFAGVNWDYTTAAEWVTQYEAIITVLQSKFPLVKEIDFIDEAIQTVVGRHSALVHAAPKVFAPTCAVFIGGGPHFTADGMKVVAKVYGDLYAAEP